MPAFVIGFLIALVVAILVTPLVTDLGHKLNILDRPDAVRKFHARAIPRIGGVALAIAVFTPMVTVSLYDERTNYYLYVYQGGRYVLGLAISGLLILALGIYDDVRGASPYLKLFVQTAVAVLMWSFGFQMEKLGPIVLGWYSLPLTVLWLVATINALNLIDGLDGLAAGTGVFATIVLFGLSISQGDPLLPWLVAMLGGALVGFLFHNINPARIFLGDCGSMFLGLWLGSISLWTQMKGATMAAISIPVLALGLPILDTSISFIRRIAARKSPFAADRGHIHHRFLALGLSHGNAVSMLYLVSTIFGLGAVAMLRDEDTRQSIALSLLIVAVVLIVQKTGLLRAPVHLIQHASLAELRDEARVAARQIRAATTVECAWGVLMNVAPRFHFESLQLTHLEGETELVLRWAAPEGAGQPKVSAERRAVMPGLEHYNLVEGEMRYGELRITHPKANLQETALLELVNELLRDAMVDVYHRMAIERGTPIGSTAAQASTAAEPSISEPSAPAIARA